MPQFEYANLTPNKLPPAWPKGLLIFTLIIFIFILGSNFGLKIYTQIKLSELNSINKNINDIRNTFPKEDEARIALFEKKLSTLNTLLNNHIYFSKIIKFLETYTHPNVYYTNVNFDLDSRTLKLEGVASNQEVASEAINGFANNSSDVQTIIVRNIKINDDQTANFNIDLILQPTLFK